MFEALPKPLEVMRAPALAGLHHFTNEATCLVGSEIACYVVPRLVEPVREHDDVVVVFTAAGAVPDVVSGFHPSNITGILWLMANMRDSLSASTKFRSERRSPRSRHRLHEASCMKAVLFPSCATMTNE